MKGKQFSVLESPPNIRVPQTDVFVRIGESSTAMVGTQSRETEVPDNGIHLEQSTRPTDLKSPIMLRVQPTANVGIDDGSTFIVATRSRDPGQISNSFVDRINCILLEGFDDATRVAAPDDSEVPRNSERPQLLDSSITGKADSKLVNELGIRNVDDESIPSGIFNVGWQKFAYKVATIPDEAFDKGTQLIIKDVRIERIEYNEYEGCQQCRAQYCYHGK